MFDLIDKFIQHPIKEIVFSLNPINVIEIGVIGLFVFAAYQKFIKGTQSERLLKGILMLLFALLLSKFLILLKLQILGKFLESLVSIVIFGLVVIFQPELRRFLGYLGQPGFLSRNFLSLDGDKDVKNIATEITDAIKHLSKSRTGALIVIENTTGVGSYIEVGTKLNAKISTELLLTIFHPSTPLHDGAVVLKGEKILSAGVLLPLTEDPKLSWQYGTRHRAAIGMSEVSDSSCLVVSEETGDVSIATAGKLQKFESIEELKIELESLYGYVANESDKEKNSGLFSFNNFFHGEFSKFPSFLTKDTESK